MGKVFQKTDCKDIETSYSELKTSWNASESVKHAPLMVLVSLLFKCVDALYENEELFPEKEEADLLNKILEEIAKQKQEFVKFHLDKFKKFQLAVIDHVSVFQKHRPSSFYKFIREAVYSSYYHLFEASANSSSFNELVKSLDEVMQLDQKREEMITNVKIEKWLKGRKSSSSLYKVYSEVRSAIKNFKDLNAVEKKWVVKGVLHTVGEFTKSSAKTSNIEEVIQKYIEDKGLFLKPIQRYRNFISHSPYLEDEVAVEELENVFPAIENIGIDTFTAVEIEDKLLQIVLGFEAAHIDNKLRTFRNLKPEGRKKIEDLFSRMQNLSIEGKSPEVRELRAEIADIINHEGSKLFFDTEVPGAELLNLDDFNFEEMSDENLKKSFDELNRLIKTLSRRNYDELCNRILKRFNLKKLEDDCELAATKFKLMDYFDGKILGLNLESLLKKLENKIPYEAEVLTALKENPALYFEFLQSVNFFSSDNPNFAQIDKFDVLIFKLEQKAKMQEEKKENIEKLISSLQEPKHESKLKFEEYKKMVENIFQDGEKIDKEFILFSKEWIKEKCREEFEQKIDLDMDHLFTDQFVIKKPTNESAIEYRKFLDSFDGQNLYQEVDNKLKEHYEKKLADTVLLSKEIKHLGARKALLLDITATLVDRLEYGKIKELREFRNYLAHGDLIIDRPTAEEHLKVNLDTLIGKLSEIPENSQNFTSETVEEIFKNNSPLRKSYPLLAEESLVKYTPSPRYKGNNTGAKMPVLANTTCTSRKKRSPERWEEIKRHFSTDSSDQSTLASSSSSKPSSFINDLFGWIKTSIGGLFNPKHEKTSSTLQIDPPIDVHGMIMLLDIFIRKITGQKYIFLKDQPVSSLEAQGYAINITQEFERIVEEAVKSNKMSMDQLDIDYIAIQKEVNAKIMGCKFNEISKVLKLLIEKVYSRDVNGEKFSQLMNEVNKRMDAVLSQSINEALLNGEGTLEANDKEKRCPSQDIQCFAGLGDLTQIKDKLGHVRATLE